MDFGCHMQKHHSIKSQPNEAVTMPLEAHDPYASSYHDDYELREDKLINGVKFKLFMSEFLATFLFVYLGQAALTAYELFGTQNDTINRQLATILTYGLSYLLVTLLVLNLSGAHLNPAYTLSRALFGYLKWNRVFCYMSAQYLGSFLAAIFLHATYNDKLNQRHTEGQLIGMNVTLRAYGNMLSTGKLFSSYPPTEVSLTQLTISYTLATAHLMFLLLAIHESKLVRIPRSIRPIYLASSLCLIMAAFSANGGPVVNPAQDFSPRLYISLFGWGSSAFNLYHYKYWWLCGIVAPHLGAMMGFGLYELFRHLSSIHDRTTTSTNHDHSNECNENNYAPNRVNDF